MRLSPIALVIILTSFSLVTAVPVDDPMDLSTPRQHPPDPPIWQSSPPGQIRILDTTTIPKDMRDRSNELVEFTKRPNPDLKGDYAKKHRELDKAAFKNEKSNVRQVSAAAYDRNSEVEFHKKEAEKDEKEREQLKEEFATSRRDRWASLLSQESGANARHILHKHFADLHSYELAVSVPS
jgi:hypothetical protein